MKFTAKRVVVAVAVAGVAVVGVGATVIATAADPVSPEITGGAPADAGHGDEGKYTTGDYVLTVHELDDDGEGVGTAIGPHTTYYSKTLHGNGNRRHTVVKFSAGPDGDGPIAFSYPVPAAGRAVDCVASGTEAAPQVRCETELPAG